MTYRGVLSSSGAPFHRSISLATHLGTDIPNGTLPSDWSGSAGQQEKNRQWAHMYREVRPPIAGFNCFGQVFGSRRTAIYFERGDPVDCEQVLCEDGFLEIGVDVAEPGDVILYYDDGVAFHATRIVRVEQGTAEPRKIVVSKFGDVSGEYEHSVDDLSWVPYVTQIAFKAFRDRGRAPAQRQGWRGIVMP